MFHVIEFAKKIVMDIEMQDWERLPGMAECSEVTGHCLTCCHVFCSIIICRTLL